MAKFGGNNSAWFVVSVGLRHVGRDDLRSSWSLAVNCFLMRRYIGIGMKQNPNVWNQIELYTWHTKENNFNHYMKTNSFPLEFPLTPFHTLQWKREQQKLPRKKTPSYWAYLREPSSRKKPEVLKMSWWLRCQLNVSYQRLSSVKETSM